MRSRSMELTYERHIDIGIAFVRVYRYWYLSGPEKVLCIVWTDWTL